MLPPAPRRLDTWVPRSPVVRGAQPGARASSQTFTRQVSTRARKPVRNAARDIYHALLQRPQDATTLAAAQAYLEREIAAVRERHSPLPADCDQLFDWMERQHHEVAEAFEQYRAQREAGAPRRYFGTRSHALYFIKHVAPTKLVDGAWLYGVLQHRHDPRLRPLVRTYLEELGDGSPAHNHVLLYRRLMSRFEIDDLDGIDDDAYVQGALQLALGHLGERYLPEVIGYNLAYEQLPLHLLITVYELRELGIDPYYFQLHVTVDNATTGHARKAVQAVLDNMPAVACKRQYLRRIANGFLLTEPGLCSTQTIASFDLERELCSVLDRKARKAQGLHSDRCRIGGRTVNEWIATGDMRPFLDTLVEAGWIQRGADPSQSRFWRLVEGDRAAMFGVFSAYERQLLRDWIANGSMEAPSGTQRSTAARIDSNPQEDERRDADILALKDQLQGLRGSEQQARLVALLAPETHHTPVGLYATRCLSGALA